MGNSTSTSSTTPNTQTVCFLLAPQSSDFAGDVVDAWGVAGVFTMAFPVIMAAIAVGLYLEEIYYVFLKSNSKSLKTSLLWILCIPSAVCVIGTIGVFVPRAVVYTSFMYNLFVTFCVYKYYYLIMVFAGGTKSFIEKTINKEVKSNLLPICCLVCLPGIENSRTTTKVIKWLVLQYIIMSPLLGSLSMILKADGEYYTTDAVGSAFYISLVGGISTLICMYGMKLLNTFVKLIDGMDKVHKIKGKAWVMQLSTFVVGFEELIFNILAAIGVFPCEYPLNFLSRRKVIYNYFVIPQIFAIAFLSRHYFRRSQDIQRQVVLHDDLTQAVEEGNAAAFNFAQAEECDRIATAGTAVVYKSFSHESSGVRLVNNLPGVSTVTR